MELGEMAAAEEASKEAVKLAKRVEIRKDIEAQLEKRRIQKQVELEARDQEGAMMQARIKADLEETKKKAILKRKKQARMIAEVAEANRIALLHKQAVKEAEQKEEARLLEMARIKVEIEEEEARQKEEEKAARDAKFWKLAKQQKKRADDRGEEDEKRARRYREEKVLADRRALAAAKKRREEAKVEMMRSLDAQIRLKGKVREEEARQDAIMVAAAAFEAEEAAAREDEVVRSKAEEKERYGVYMRKTMRERELAKMDARLEPFRERQAIAIEEKARENLLLRKKKQTIARMKRRGIPDKYLRDVLKVDMMTE